MGLLRSDFRPLPDNQEVFANAENDQSIVIELLQHEVRAGGTRR